MVSATGAAEGGGCHAGINVVGSRSTAIPGGLIIVSATSGVVDGGGASTGAEAAAG
ncbi:MAG TPA: hypothetical protein VEU76_04885 [Candidatus Udaeobacter sp.]|nr:hypothetical protein [Candidatus Udaeobacter sp.]